MRFLERNQNVHLQRMACLKSMLKHVTWLCYNKTSMNSTIPVPIDNGINNVIGVDSTIPSDRYVNNNLESRSLLSHVPDFCSTRSSIIDIYISTKNSNYLQILLILWFAWTYYHVQIKIHLNTKVLGQTHTCFTT